MKGKYNDDSLKTFEKITNNLSCWNSNTLYHNTQYDKYFFINAKGYLHCFLSSKKSINEYMLTSDNNLKWVKKTDLITQNDKDIFIKYLNSAIEV